MKFLLIVLSLIFTSCKAGGYANEYEAKKAKVTNQMRVIPEFTCFRDFWFYKADLPWEVSGKRVGEPHMIIKKSDQGVLFAQPVPECRKGGHKSDTGCGYWIRSTTWKDNFIMTEVEAVACPVGLNKEFVLKLIKTEYSDQFKLGE